MTPNALPKISMRVLCLEDSPQDAEIIRELLVEAGYDLRVDWTDTEKEYTALLRGNKYDIILSDFRLPGFNAFGALQLAIDICPKVPFICVSGSIGEETAIELIKKGAIDYILKDRLVRLPSAIKRALAEVEEKESRRLAEEALRESENRYRLLFDSSMDAILLTAPTGEIYAANLAACRMVAMTEKEICAVGRNGIVDVSDSRLQSSLEERTRTGKFIGELTMLRKNGGSFPAEISTAVFIDKEGRDRSSMIIRDISDRKMAELEILKLNRTYAVLSSINQLIVHAHSGNKLFDDTCRIVVELGGMSFCWIGTIDEPSGDIRPVAKAGLINGFLDKLSITLTSDSAQKNASGAAVWNGSKCICNDMEHEELVLLWQKVALEQGARSSAVIPLCIGAKTVGIMNFYASEANYFDAKEMELLDELAADISFAMEMLENENKRKWIEEKNAEQARLLDVAIDAIIVRDMNDRLLFWNKGAEHLYGWTFAEAQNIDPIEFVDTDEEQKYEQCKEMFFREGRWEGELHQQTKAHGRIVTYSRWTLVCTPDGERVSRLIITRDITDRKRMEEEARKLSRAVEQSPVSVIITDTKGNIEYVNPRFTEITGYTTEEVLGKNPRILKSGITPREEYERLWRIISSGKEWHGEFQNKKKNGSLYWESASISPVFGDNGAITHYLAVKEDITERKRTEDALRESEERYRTLIRNQGEGISMCDENDRFIFANPAAEALFQVPAGTLRGRNLHEFIMPEYLSIHQMENEKLGVGDRSTFEYDIKTMKGERRSLLVTTLKQLNNKGMYTGTFSVFRDITERKKIEEKLRESEEYYRTLVDATPDAIVIIDNQGIMTFASPKIFTVFDIQSDKLIGNSFFRLVHPDNHAILRKHIREIFRQETGAEVREYHLLKSDNVPFWGEISTSPLYNAQGTIAGLLMLCRDVTDKKRLQQELVQSQKLQSIGRLAGGIAHDFNNILGIILAYTSMLQHRKMSEEKISDSLAGIDHAVQRGAALVRQILTFARKTDILIEPLNLPDLVRELLAMLIQTFPKTITFTEHIESDLPYILADHTQIHQALLNLCVNARDAMPNGGAITLTIEKKTKEQVRERFSSADQELYICVAVQDTGEGMSEETRVKIFDPFFTTKEPGKGTGLGLSVVFGVVESHHGFIDIESKLGHGTTFRLYFPTSGLDAKQSSVVEPENIRVFNGTETILIVEDEEFLLEMAVLIAESQGYHVFTARDGLNAIEVYREHRDEIALVLSDMGLPGMTGQDAFRRLKEINPYVKVVFASGNINPDVQSELLKDGAKGFVQKPYTSNALLQIVRTVLDGN
jgi:two-component system, cell cycle sensor histidine kinase and response regulator CckA